MGRSGQQGTTVTIDKIKNLLEAQGRHGNWNYSSYMCGLYNGIELCIATLEDRDPVYRDKPTTGWLSNPKDEDIFVSGHP